MTRTKTLIATVTAIGVIAGATGIVLAVGPANADPTPASSPPAASVAQAVQAFTSPASPQVQGAARGTTVVTFDDGVIAALAALSPEPIRPASLALTSDEAAVVAKFPISSAQANGPVRHVGGLTFTDGPNTLTLLNYTITGGTLTAQAFINGEQVGTIDFLSISPTSPTGPCDVAADLTLSAPAAFALSKTFGIADLSGTAIGTACVDLP
jgi:hypothetical protein